MKIREAGTQLSRGLLFALLFCVPVSFITDLSILALLTSPWTLLAITLPICFAASPELLTRREVRARASRPVPRSERQWTGRRPPR